MKTLYLDIFSGISGDMFIGAMLDLGVDFGRLEGELGRLGVGGYRLQMHRRSKSSIEGVKFDVCLEAEAGHSHGHEPAHGHGHEPAHSHGHEPAHSHGHEPAHSHEHGRTYEEIRKLIDGSGLSEWVKGKSKAVFHRVAVAEGKVHGQPVDRVHFHEVGAVDSIVDIVGACICLEELGRPRVLSAKVVEGHGWVNCAHGRFPVPTTATLEILAARGIGVTQCEEAQELVTPTGAALLAEFVETFGPMQGLTGQRIGYGLGTRDNRTRPNVLRAILGEENAGAGGRDWERDVISVLESNLDDVSGEVLGRFMEQALNAGALDVFYAPVQMKKNRPGVVLTVLSGVEKADDLTEMILRETSAFGVRRSILERRKLRREIVTVTTPYGEVRVKLGRLNGRVVQVAPEYESCRAAADATVVPLREVYRAASAVGRGVGGDAES